MDRRAADRLLLAAARRGGPWVPAMMATSLLLAGVYTVLPALMGRTVDAVLADGDTAVWLALSIAAIVVLMACDLLDDLVGKLAEARSTAWLRHTLLRHVLDLGIRATRRFTAGDLVGRLVGNSARTGQVASTLVWAVVDLVPPVGAIVALALIDPWLCLTFLVGLPVVLSLVRTFIRDASDINERYYEAQGRVAARLVDALAGIRTIAAAGTVDREVGRVLGPLPELHRHGAGMWRVLARVSGREALVIPLLEVAVLAVAGLQLAHGRISPGQVLAAGEYVVLATGISSLVSSASRLALARATAGRVAEVLAEPPVAYGGARLPDGPGTLEFRGVTVRGPSGGTVLEDLRLTVPGGALVAVVGRSGSGKSVLAALAGRLTDPDEGEVLLDGVPLRQLGRPALREAVAYGFERPVLLGETFADAIGFGPRPAADGEVVRAAAAARADGFIRRLPQGYGTRPADAPVSGGEAQRVGLARAFAQAGRVLVLDDVAASLDTVTEHHISQVLTGALAGRTRLVVTHRASTAARADRVVWLDGGGVRGQGTHRELWSQPAYRAAFQPDGAGTGAEAAASAGDVA
ncbi:ABC transporter ATP-binding protein [Streptomyces purpurogeneiscleroticus]|uniref:ABC transporter ATP-binding protein n=1 Tax=Streptomyces purpurogeneiscleroticus TaxID=68259 RepID=UPI001CC13C01|nr:ABC transporter ATP-binding protein [Streptomyces purpurogeneiscleroticus]MBZ4017394.1 ABC transporter ATP-binding protein [Streptomyces purpurogeneiscleroticus]